MHAQDLWCGGEKEELEKEISVKQSVLWKMQAHKNMKKKKITIDIMLARWLLLLTKTMYNERNS